MKYILLRTEDARPLLEAWARLNESEWARGRWVAPLRMCRLWNKLVCELYEGVDVPLELQCIREGSGKAAALDRLEALVEMAEGGERGE